MLMERQVERHYGRGQLIGAILRALADSGKDPARLAPSDLAPVDEFHIRGREATIELAHRAQLKPGLKVLDVGSGLGGSVRLLASEHQCQVTGVDLTQEYVDVANALADLVGLQNRVEFRQASALNLPFDDGSFDVVWTEHVQMNIARKHAFYAEIARVLKPQGRLAFHDIFEASGEALEFPVPWAEDPSISFLIKPRAVREILEGLGFEILDWEDKTRHSLEWYGVVMDRFKLSGPPPLGLHLLMGTTAKAKFENIVRNLQQGRIVVFQAVALKRESPTA
jgi:MPBQ/MSBQ methyltransferase